MIVKRSARDLSLLWREYKQVGTATLRNELVEHYLWLVKSIVSKLMGRAFAKHVGSDEIEAAGNFGLIQAVEGFDLERGIKFETYAHHRILGAILDWLRDIDWIPRTVRSNAKLYEKAIAALQGGSGQKPTIEEIAEYLHITVEVAEGLQQDAAGAAKRFRQDSEHVRGDEDTFRKVFALDQMPDPKTLTPQDEVTESAGFDDLITCLTDREQITITLYYRDSFTMKQIGCILGVSESRVSQIHDGALLKVKDSFL